MHEEILNRFTLVMQKHVEELEGQIHLQSDEIHQLKGIEKRAEAAVKEIKAQKDHDGANYRRQIDALFKVNTEYLERIASLNLMAKEKLSWLKEETPFHNIEKAIIHIGELQETNKKIYQELKKAKEAAHEWKTKTENLRNQVFAAQEKIQKECFSMRNMTPSEWLNWIGGLCVTHVETIKQLRDNKASVTRRRNQLLRQLRENDIEPVDPH